MRKVINKKTIGGFFLAALVLLIFFSKTIYDYNLPDVTAVEPERGPLSKLEMSAGVADWAEVENLYAPVSGTVEEVFISEGEYVKAGQELYRMEFDRDETVRKLSELENNKQKLQIDIQNTKLRLEDIERSIGALSGGGGYELEVIDMDIKKAEDAVYEAVLLYDLGEISLSELEEAKSALDALYLKRAETQRKNQDTLSGCEADKAALLLDLQAKNLDLENLALQAEPYQKMLEEYDKYAVITAPADGYLLALDAEKGLSINENTLTASIGVGSEFIVECAVSLDNNFVIPGDACKLDNSVHRLDGVVKSVTPAENGKTVEVLVSAEDVTAGETFDILFEKESATSYTLVPNGALNQDNDGYFLNQVKRREGILGDEYYIERLDVYIGDSDSEHTAIVEGITFFEPVVLVSDKPVEAGDVISLENAGDFFED